MDRKLAAFLAADVVGYSALMERDEVGTFARLRELRQALLEPVVKEHHGRIFKMMGDGFLVEFASVVDAVACAAALQMGVAERNKAAAENERILLRVGVNLGDVIVEGDDRHGEGVNIAARLEQLADPGGICVSQPVIDQLSNKLPLVFEAIGEHKVKNIEKPVRAYRAKLDGVAKVSRKPAPLDWRRAAAAAVAMLLLAGGAWYALQAPSPEPVVATESAVVDGKPSLVVLPFANLSDDKEQGYLADGITEDLTTELARVPGLFVISRNAAFTYKGKPVPPSQITKELGVSHIVEGSIRRAGQDMRINAQLIDARSGGHLWAERYDGGFADVFSLQDKVVGQIVQSLGLRLASNSSVAPGGTANAAAYEAYLQGLDLLWRHWRAPPKTIENLFRAIPHFEQAIALDADYGDAHGALAEAYWAAANGPGHYSKLSYDETVARRDRHLQAGIEHSSARAFRDAVATAQGFEEAIAFLDRAIALNPSDAENHDGMAWWLIAAGRTAEAQRHLDTAHRLDPRAVEYTAATVGMLQFSAGNFAAAAASWEAYLAAFPNDTRFHVPLAAAYAHLGRSDDAARHYGRDPKDLLWAKSVFPFKQGPDGERLAEGLGKAGAPALPFGYDPQSPDRLTTEQMSSLIFGRTVRYRELETEGRTASTTFKADGTALLTRGAITEAGNPVLADRGICFWWRKDGLECAVVYRNPNGTSAKGDEYIWINPWTRWAFSVVK